MSTIEIILIIFGAFQIGAILFVAGHVSSITDELRTGNDHLRSIAKSLRLSRPQKVIAKGLYLSINIGNHINISLMATQITLPIGASVPVTVKGFGVDLVTGATVDAPILAASLVADDASKVTITPVAGSANQFTLVAVSDGAPTLTANATDANGVALPGATSQIQTGAGVAVPVTATSLGISYGDIVLP